jgi:CHAD domain-containing protein
VARAREIPGLDCEEPFRLAAVRVIAARSEDVFANSDGVLDTAEIEAVHDMRVATRRLRAAMEIFEPCFPRKRHRKALKRVTELADALGERRDRDVAIEFLRQARADLPEGDRPLLDLEVDLLREEQADANRALAAHVAPKRLRKLRRRLLRLDRAAIG